MSFQFPIAQCDVADKKALVEYRTKRSQWLDWLKHDDAHAIWRAIAALSNNDVKFRVLAHLAQTDERSALRNPMVSQAVVSDYVSNQILGVRRLIDTRNDVISLRRLVRELKANANLLTRENYVAHDGMPYKYSVANLVPLVPPNVAQWVPTTGSQAYISSQLAHEYFDQLCGIPSTQRRRDDVISTKTLQFLDDCLGGCDADQLVKWSHKFLAHAADADSRRQFILVKSHPKVSQITATVQQFIRTAQAISAYILNDSTHGSIVPVAQFDRFEYLVSDDKVRVSLDRYWRDTAREYDDCLHLALEGLAANTVVQSADAR